MVEITQAMFLESVNPTGNVHGGHILKMVDQAAAIVGTRHKHQNVVIASVEGIDFISPVYSGNGVFTKVSINFTGKTSMKIDVRVETECLRKVTHTQLDSAYLTFVGLDNNDDPTEIPSIIPETNDEKWHYEEAKKRREARM